MESEREEVRQFGGWLGWATAALSIVLVGFQVLTSGFGQFPPLVQRSLHVAIALPLAFLLLSASHMAEGRKARWTNVIAVAMAAATMAASAYIGFRYDELTSGLPPVISAGGIALGIALTLAILESARRSTGPVLPALALGMIAYTLFGDLTPGLWGHPGFSSQYLFEHLYLGGEGIWGMITGLSAGLIGAFIILGAFLLATGAADGFMDLSQSVAGRSTGGAAKVATLSSALFGMLNGAAVANVATTGNFTIPAMKRLGYRKEFAAAVEACASSGGQITPPIMGAGAFVMAELLGRPYADIVVAALVPAFLFYVCIWFSIDIEARKTRLRIDEEAKIPALRDVLTWERTGPVGLTVLVIAVALLSGRTPMLAAFYGICTSIGVYLLRGGIDSAAWLTKLATLRGGAELAAKGIATILPLLLCAQISLSLIGLTGIGVKLSEQIISVGTDYGLFSGLILTLIVALVLGMGMPTTAAYLLAAAVTVPALGQLGVNPLATHFFVFYGALLSGLTPPVCTAVFTAAVIARAHWWPVALAAMRLAAMIYVLPFFFMYRPEVFLSAPLAQTLLVVAAGVAASYLLAVGLGGFLHRTLPPALRILLSLSACAMVSGSPVADIIGFGLALMLLVWNARQKNGTPPA